jgi:hypothetical protein
MAVATITQCETWRRAVLPSFDERYEKLIENHPDAKKEMDLARACVVQVVQLVQNLTKVNCSGAKWKQLADRTEAKRHILCKPLGGRVLFTGLFRIYAAVWKGIRGMLQPSAKESG